MKTVLFTRNVYVQKSVGYLQRKNKKDECVFTKVFWLFTLSTVFIVPRPPPPPPIPTFVECVDSTERSSASKNSNVSSGTWPAGDRPVPQTRSFLTAISTHRGSQSSWRGSTGEIAARAFAA